MSFQKTVLPNGLILATDHVPGSKGVAIRLILRSGSRHEDVQGALHFMEHLLGSSLMLNGQESYHFLKTITNEINFFTGKEGLEIKVDTLPQFVPAVMDAISHILTGPRWSVEARERERARILGEYAEDEGKPDTKARVKFWEYALGEHPLAPRILGTPETIASMSEEILRDTMKRHVCAQRMAVFISGSLSHEQSLRDCAGPLGAIASGTPVPAQPAPRFAPPRTVFEKHGDDTQLTTLVLPYDLRAKNSVKRPAVAAISNLYLEYLNKMISDMALNYSGAVGDYVEFSDMAYLAAQFNGEAQNAGNLAALAYGCFLKPEHWLTRNKFELMKLGWQMNDAFTGADPRVRAGFMSSRFERSGQVLSYETIDSEYETLSFEEVLAAYHLFDPRKVYIYSQGPNGDLPRPEDLTEMFAEELQALRAETVAPAFEVAIG